MTLDSLIKKWAKSLDKKNNPIISRTFYNNTYPPICSTYDYIIAVSRFMLGLDYYYIKYAIFYVAKYAKNKNIKVNIFNIQRLYLLACSVTVKFWFDIIPDNLNIATSDNIRLHVFNQMEIDFLNGLNWDLYENKDGIDDNTLISSLTIINPNFKHLQEGVQQIQPND